MKYLLLLIFLLPIQEQKIVTCEVIEPDKSVACPEGGKMVLFSFDDATEAKAIFDEWRLVAPLRGSVLFSQEQKITSSELRVNVDAPLSSRVIRAGDKVKAEIDDNKFRSIASCEVRVYRNVKYWRQFKEGERIPNLLFTMPDDCQPWYGKN